MHLAQVWTAKVIGPIHDPVFQPYLLVSLMHMEGADAWMEVWCKSGEWTLHGYLVSCLVHDFLLSKRQCIDALLTTHDWLHHIASSKAAVITLRSNSMHCIM